MIAVSVAYDRHLMVITYYKDAAPGSSPRGSARHSRRSDGCAYRGKSTATATCEQ
jgi:hypothetical protein